jgi:hypothetical protein
MVVVMTVMMIMIIVTKWSQPESVSPEAPADCLAPRTNDGHGFQSQGKGLTLSLASRLLLSMPLAGSSPPGRSKDLLLDGVVNGLVSARPGLIGWLGWSPRCVGQESHEQEQGPFLVLALGFHVLSGDGHPGQASSPSLHPR